MRRKEHHIHVREFIDKDNRQERTMKRMKAVCLKEIDSDGNAIWEMVNTEKGECVDYFGSPDEAREYASSHGIEITEFVVGDWKKK